MGKLYWSKNSEQYDLEKLAESIYDEEGGFAKISTKHTNGLGEIEYPEYLGFYQGRTLHIHTSSIDSKQIWFSGGAKWGESECLKKFLVLFYMERKLYPSFENFEGHLIMTLEEI